MTKDNKELIEQVKNLVTQKKRVHENKVNINQKDVSNDLVKESIESWINENAEKIAKEIIRENLKKILK